MNIKGYVPFSQLVIELQNKGMRITQTDLDYLVGNVTALVNGLPHYNIEQCAVLLRDKAYRSVI